MSFTAVPRRQLVASVIQQLQERISLGEIHPGSKLPPEPELMAQFGVGRSTLREAVRVLAHAGLLEVRQGDGTYVRAASEAAEPLDRRLRRAAIAEVYEVRRALELETARLAAARRDQSDLARLRECLDRRCQAQAAGDPEAYIEADLAFHAAIAAAGKNSVLTDLYRTFSQSLRDALTNLVADPELHRDTASLHEAILTAIEQGDPNAAVRRTGEHLDATAGLLRDLAARC